MIYFPQLAQFPIRKRRYYRTVVNELPDGSQVKARLGRARLEWEISLRGLDDNERDRIWSTWHEAGGRARAFTYVDPTANLLRWSTDFTRAFWVRDTGVTATATTVSNTTQATAAIHQTISAPAWFRYCFSFRVRGSSPAPVVAFRAAEGAESALEFQPTASWTRVLLSGELAASGGAIDFGFRLPAGASIELGGVQVEAQTASSAYKPTTSLSAVYPNARFADDELKVAADGVHMHSAIVRIVATEPQS
jgi:hypothetical protein